MKNTFVILFAIASVSSAFANGFKPVPGSCTSYGMGPNLCSCDLQSTTGGDDASILHSSNVPCQILQCSDFLDAENCGGMKQADCELSNRYYSGECSVTVLYPSSDGNGALQACTDVQRELNQPFSSGHDYCDATTLRGGWKLDSSN